MLGCTVTVFTANWRGHQHLNHQRGQVIAIHRPAYYRQQDSATVTVRLDSGTEIQLPEGCVTLTR